MQKVRKVGIESLCNLHCHFESSQTPLYWSGLDLLQATETQLQPALEQNVIPVGLGQWLYPGTGGTASAFLSANPRQAFSTRQTQHLLATQNTSHQHTPRKRISSPLHIEGTNLTLWLGPMLSPGPSSGGQHTQCGWNRLTPRKTCSIKGVHYSAHQLQFPKEAHTREPHCLDLNHGESWAGDF